MKLRLLLHQIIRNAVHIKELLSALRHSNQGKSCIMLGCLTLLENYILLGILHLILKLVRHALRKSNQNKYPVVRLVQNQYLDLRNMTLYDKIKQHTQISSELVLLAFDVRRTHPNLLGI